jgi:putative two-component system response regulator
VKEVNKIDVLVVDDEKVFCMILEKRLEALGFKSMAALSATEALDILEENQPEMIITDLMMPEMDGIEFTTLLRKKRRFQHVYVLMLSARSDKDAKVDSKKAGANEFVTKPIDDDELSIKVKLGIDWTRNRLEKEKRKGKTYTLGK